jgi:hypothetical protein
MLDSILIFAAVAIVALVAGYLAYEYVPDLIQIQKMKVSERVVSQLVKVEKPTWAATGRASVTVYTSSEGVSGCTVTASFTGEERFEHSKISYHPRR